MGVFAGSTAVIMIKSTAVDSVALAAYRQLIAAAVLAPLFLRSLRRQTGRYGWGMFRRTLLPGTVLGVHFITWIIGAKMTPAAHSSLIVNMVPVVMPFLLYFLIREVLNRGEVVGTLLAIAGVAILAWGDWHSPQAAGSPSGPAGGQAFLGDLICFGSMILFGWYLAMGRQNRDFASIWLYVAPVYLVGGLVCLAVVPVAAASMAIPTAWDAFMVVGLGIVPTVFGHSIFNYSMKHLRGQAVSIANMGQFVFAGVMGFFWLNETPGWMFYAACVLVVAGSVLALRSVPAPPTLKLVRNG